MQALEQSIHSELQWSTRFQQNFGILQRVTYNNVQLLITIYQNSSEFIHNIIVLPFCTEFCMTTFELHDDAYRGSGNLEVADHGNQLYGVLNKGSEIYQMLFRGSKIFIIAEVIVGQGTPAKCSYSTVCVILITFPCK